MNSDRLNEIKAGYPKEATQDPCYTSKWYQKACQDLLADREQANLALVECQKQLEDCQKQADDQIAKIVAAYVFKGIEEK